MNGKWIAAALTVVLISAAMATVDLRYNTASQEVPLGYFVDKTDGDTEETGLTISATDIFLWKAGGTRTLHASTAATHMNNGIYYTVLDANDTNTKGPLKVFVHESGALARTADCRVLDPNEYDRLYANGEVNVYSIGGSKAVATAMVTKYATNWATVWNTTTLMENTDVNLVQGGEPLYVPGTSNLIDGFRAQIWEAAYDDGNDNSPAKRIYVNLTANAAALIGAPILEDLSHDIAAISVATALAGQTQTTVNSATSASVFIVANGPSTDTWFGRREWLAVVFDADEASGIPAVETIKSYVAATRTITLAADLPFTPAASDVVYFVPMAWNRPSGGRVGAK